MNCDANQFARAVPGFWANEGRFADMVRLGLEALEQEMGIGVDGGQKGFWVRLLGRG